MSFTSIEVMLLFILGLLGSFFLVYFILMLYESKKTCRIKKSIITPQVSLVIPTYNEEKTILRRLKNVEEQKYPKKKLQILVVDSGSSDRTRKFVRDYMSQVEDSLNVELITQPERMGKAAALNYAWQNCCGEIVMITDADAMFERNAMSKIVCNFSDPNVGAVTGRLIIPNEDFSAITKSEKCYRKIYETLRLGESNLDSTPVFNGPISAFRREVLDKLESNTIADDTELAVRVREKGLKSIYDPEAIAYEYTSTKFASRLKQKIRRGQGIMQSFARHRRILFNTKYGKYGVLIFPSEFFMHLVSPMLIGLMTILFFANIILDPTRIGISVLTILALLIIVSGLAFGIQIGKEKMTNPLRLLLSFIEHQACLIVGLPLLLVGKAHIWSKIEDVRNINEVPM